MGKLNTAVKLKVLFDSLNFDVTLFFKKYFLCSTTDILVVRNWNYRNYSINKEYQMCDCFCATLSKNSSCPPLSFLLYIPEFNRIDQYVQTSMELKPHFSTFWINPVKPVLCCLKLNTTFLNWCTISRPADHLDMVYITAPVLNSRSHYDWSKSLT